MAACVRTWILKLCVFTKIFLLITAQTEHMTNVAVHKQCNISSQYKENNLSNDCSAAINGKTDTTFITEKASQNCIHTDGSDFHPTWSVDLGQNFSVHRITIYGRDNYERRMGCVQVLLDGQQLYTFPCSGAANFITDSPVYPPQRGRVVTITRYTTPYNPEPFLNICEIQIWVCSIGWWGNDCQKQCSCQDKDNHCDPENGTCLKTNVAVHKPCNISSKYEENHLSNDCTAAINGNTDTTLVIQKTPQNCIHTSITDFHPTWSVDLGQNFSVHSITIYGRDTLERRMDCVQVFLDGRQLYKFQCPGTTNVTTDIYVNPVQRGQVVRVTNDQKSDDDPVPFLNICEIQIWVCSIGWWGSECQNQCSCQGQNHICDPDNGTCSKECSKGYWGDHCSHVCGRGCKNGDCNIYNGTCECNSGWAAPSCDVCFSGYWGENCTACGAGCSNTCDAKTGACRCTNMWTGPQCTDCTKGHWGDNCSNVCGRGCKNGDCNVYNGTCECKSRWAGQSCDVCSDGQYNPSNDCQNTCGRGCNNTCSKTNGTCLCRPGWQPHLCQECSEGHYNMSNDCQNTCSKGCNDTCSRTNGVCHCRSGWNQSLCQNCVDGHYNESNDCQDTCGEGCNNTCSRTDGTCQCRSGWEPPLCTNCENGYYSVSTDCQNTCGEGCNNNTCSRTDGTCQCRPGWQPPLCQHCADGHYNESNNCQNTCGEGCNNTCSKTDGTCQCLQNWDPPLCQDCAVGHYNESDDCQNTCGKGCQGTCSRTSGTCQCKQNWDPPLCQEKMQFRGDESSPAPVGAIVGPVVVVILVAGAVVLIVIVWRRRQYKGNQRMPQTSQFEVPKDIQHQLLTEYPGNESAQEGVVNVTVASDNKPVVPVKPQTYAKLVDSIDDKHVYNNETPANDQRNSALASPRSSEAGNGNESAEKTNENNSPKKDKNKRDSKPPPIAQKPVAKTENAANTRLYENVDLVKNSWKISENGENQNPPTKSEEKDQEAVNGVDEEGEDIYNTEDIYGSYRSMGSSSILDDFQKSLLARLASGKLGIEFAEFPKDMQHLCKVGSKPENSKKNRFKALCAYDHSRVVLRRPKGDNNTDYVNASYIKGCRREKAYIATQGPRSNTVDDFWWMVWQENITQIVMLTNIKEGGKDKCEEYWPPVGNAKTYGHVTVTALKTDTRADFVVRSFVVGTKKDGDQRRVSQYHYLVWPDHGVPSTLSLVNFWRYVKARAQGAIPVVHCSAGVGRTGTYIALDIASDLRSRGRDVNVKEIVSGLREDRTLMVQTEAQYKFLHEAILEEYSSRATRINFEQFDAIFPDTIDINTKSKVDKEFKILSQMGMFVPRPKYTTAASKQNMPKNRNRESLPDDGHLVYIPGHVPGRNQYINAVYMSSLRKRRGLILTQLPLPDTVVDMWRLIDGWNINTVVSLGHKDQKKSVKNYCRYWPETEQDALKTKQHTIGLTSTATLGDHLTCYDLSLTTKESTDRSVRVLYYDDWADQIPGKISDILHLIDILESWHVEEDTSPVVVQCSDGVTRSGMFCALYDVINRARIDQEVDVYLPVRQVQTVRPKAFTTEMQYRYCYQAVQEYKRQDSVYQNM